MSRRISGLGLSLAIVAMLPLRVATPAQTPSAESTSAQRTPALSSSTSQELWASLRQPEAIVSSLNSLPSFSSSSSGSLAVLPPVSPAFAAIFAVPCVTPPISNPAPNSNDETAAPQPCPKAPTYARFLNTPAPAFLTPAQKAHLALHDIKDLSNLATITYNAAFTVGTNPHTAYGPGWKGFGRDAGYSFVQDATGEFFSTFLIASIAHEDPRYHRMPGAPIPRRFLHAISHTFISQSDTGRPMPNFCALLTYPIGAEIGNLYVPGIDTNGPSTVERVFTGYATDPVDSLVTEFLPDVARHIHVHVIFAQRILNQISSDQYTLP